MNTKVFVLFAVLLLAVAVIPESEAFTAGGGGNIPGGGKKRELMVRLPEMCLCSTFSFSLFPDPTITFDII